METAMTHLRPQLGYPGLALVTILMLYLFSAQLHTAEAQEVYLGEIVLVPYNFAMNGYAECNGQLLPISQNTALFSLLGTMYGGDGRSTFALPDLRDRLPICQGQGPGLSNYDLGQTGGEMDHALTIPEMPVHSHLLYVDGNDGTSDTPAGGFPAVNTAGISAYSLTSNGATLHPSAIGTTGSGQPHNNLQPFLGLRYVIAMTGIYPPRQ
jgi:microcystin-dependent protein